MAQQKKLSSSGVPQRTISPQREGPKIWIKNTDQKHGSEIWIKNMDQNMAELKKQQWATKNHLPHSKGPKRDLTQICFPTQPAGWSDATIGDATAPRHLAPIGKSVYHSGDTYLHQSILRLHQMVNQCNHAPDHWRCNWTKSSSVWIKWKSMQSLALVICKICSFRYTYENI